MPTCARPALLLHDARLLKYSLDTLCALRTHHTSYITNVSAPVCLQPCRVSARSAEYSDHLSFCAERAVCTGTLYGQFCCVITRSATLPTCHMARVTDSLRVCVVFIPSLDTLRNVQYFRFPRQHVVSTAACWLNSQVSSGSLVASNFDILCIEVRTQFCLSGLCSRRGMALADDSKSQKRTDRKRVLTSIRGAQCTSQGISMAKNCLFVMSEKTWRFTLRQGTYK